MTQLYTGIDLVDIARLENIDAGIQDRFLQRIFTPGELEDSRGNIAQLAGRFAAKEAASKALGCGIGPIRWQDVEIRRGQAGEPILHLHGRASELAAEMGWVTWSLSISHTHSQAVAVVVALAEKDSG